MNTIEKLWMHLQNRFACDNLLQRIILLPGYLTQEVRKKNICIADRNIPVLELLAEDANEHYSCITFLEMDFSLWLKRDLIPLSDEWYGNSNGDRVIHRSPYDPQRSALEAELYSSRVEEVTNFMVCFTNWDFLFAAFPERCTAGVPFVHNEIKAPVPCPTLFLSPPFQNQIFPKVSLGKVTMQEEIS